MRKLYLIFILTIVIGCNSQKESNVAQKNEPITMDGEAYGSTYHIVYYSYDKNWNDEIKEVLEAFDNSVNTYIPTSYLSKLINIALHYCE